MHHHRRINRPVSAPSMDASGGAHSWRSAAALVVVVASALSTGCVEKSRELSRSEQERLERYVSEEPTEPQHPLSVKFEDKLELIGYDVSAESWAPGAALTFTWHWKVNRALEDGVEALHARHRHAEHQSSQ